MDIKTTKKKFKKSFGIFQKENDLAY